MYAMTLKSPRAPAVVARTRRTWAGEARMEQWTPSAISAASASARGPLTPSMIGTRLGARRLQLHVVHREQLAGVCDALTVQQPAHDLDTFAQAAQRRLEGDPHLVLDPVPVAAAQAEHDATGRNRRQRRGLHRHDGGVS